MLNIGPQELILVLVIALVVVGPQRLPELGRSLGKAIREMRKVQDEVKETLKFDLTDDAPVRGTPKPHPRSDRPAGTTTEEHSEPVESEGGTASESSTTTQTPAVASPNGATPEPPPAESAP
jgi:sec-independent protein translocase protein TatA